MSRNGHQYGPLERSDIAAAGAMAEAAEREKKVFVEHGLPEDFVEQLKAATSAINDAVGGQ
jgi:hypothetical protein